MNTTLICPGSALPSVASSFLPSFRAPGWDSQQGPSLGLSRPRPSWLWWTLCFSHHIRLQESDRP